MYKMYGIEIERELRLYTDTTTINKGQGAGEPVNQFTRPVMDWFTSRALSRAPPHRVIRCIGLSRPPNRVCDRGGISVGCAGVTERDRGVMLPSELAFPV
jgi:hypothetical protein